MLIKAALLHRVLPLRQSKSTQEAPGLTFLPFILRGRRWVSAKMLELNREHKV